MNGSVEAKTSRKDSILPPMETLHELVAGSVIKEDKPKTINPRTSFTADSPYFTAFCDNEIRSLNSLTETLRDISSRTKTFCQTGELMAEAMQRLAKSCKLRRDILEDEDDDPELVYQARRKAVGEEMAVLLENLGDVSELTYISLHWKNFVQGTKSFSNPRLHA